MKIHLFHPRGYSESNSLKQVNRLAVSQPPIGLLSIASVLRDAGHEVTFFDAAHNNNVTNDSWVKKITALSPDMVGFSAITAGFPDAYDMCSCLKKALPQVITVFGGVHASWGRDQLLKDYPDIDCLIAGEGEYAFRDLANGVKKSTIAGLYFREGDLIKSGPEQTKERLCEMDDLPFPAYDLVEGFPREYNPTLFSYPKYPAASIISSRGCVFKCSFCDRSVYHNSFRWNSPEYTFRLIKWLNEKFDVKHFMFYDDLFTVNQSRVSKLCGLIRESKLKISYNCIIRIGHVSEELISELKSSGCFMVHVGIESGDQKVLDSHKDGLSLDIIRRDVDRLHAAGLWVKGLFMMGFPGETEESIKKTIDFASSLPLKDGNLTAFTPYPGAPIYHEIPELGTFDPSPENWANLDCEKFVFIAKSGPDKEVLEKYYKEFYSKFYNRPFMRKVYRAMLFKSPHSYWRLIKNLPTFLRYVKRM